ncbi:BnaA02g13240D [Brassica napus]|uniref:BnaA02g13240D protein n=1 Tax=Brassica napus TaxID=3708 RepID=A0A078FHJ3_BRANA|nr:BnaA02g13240D [Brassica napus]
MVKLKHGAHESCSKLPLECKDCEIFLDLGCAILNNTKTSWYAEEKLHYSHAHFLRRCKPGPDARGSCLMCELPLTPSAVSYGCSQCYLFAHERCLDLPREIQHPVHQAHPLTRLDFTHTCGGGKVCDACGLHVEGAPLSCLECSFYLHLRCADSLLRGLVHKSHQHKLFYLANNAKLRFKNGCRVCMRDDDGSYGDYLYHCVECGWRSHFKCLEIPESVVNKSYHIHPLVCKIFLSEDDSLEYCDVCETMVHAGHHAYCCEECGFLSHIECILHEEMPSPLYLKDLYSHLGEKLTRPADHDDKCETKELENKLVVRLAMLRRLRKDAGYVIGFTNMRCDTCKEKIDYFNLFCRICDFIICTKCACIELWRRYRALENHPLHYNHILYMTSRKTGSKCTACKPDIDISKYVFFCSTCSLSFHFKCIQAVGISTRIKTHKHCLYNFLSDDSSRPCTICNKPCGASFYACDICNVCAHEECIGFPTYVKNQRHQHIVNLKKIYAPKICSICGLDTKFSGHKYQYTCDDCKDVFHTNCIMSMVEREAATEEEQISDLSNMLKDMDESDEEDSDSS